jgi:hypothetical protein
MFIAQASRWIFDTIETWLIVLVIAVVAADRLVMARTLPGHPDLILPRDPRPGMNPVRMLAAAAMAPPWSILAAWQVALQRRAALYGLAAGLSPESVHSAAQVVAHLGAATDRDRWRAAAPQFAQPRVWRASITWRDAVWLIAMLPGVAYLVVGGFPATRGLQQAMTSAAGTACLAVGLVAGMVVVASTLPSTLRAMRRMPADTWHEYRLRPVGHLSIAGTTLAVSAALLARLVIAGDPTDRIVNNHHVLDALSTAMLVLGLGLMIAAFIWFPPSLLAVAGGATTLVISAEMTATAAAGATIALTGVVLNQAARQRPGSGTRPANTSGADSEVRPHSPRRVNGNPAANRLAQRLGYSDAHHFKASFELHPHSHWDIYIDTKTNQVWFGRKDGSAWIPTHLTR